MLWVHPFVIVVFVMAMHHRLTRPLCMTSSFLPTEYIFRTTYASKTELRSRVSSHCHHHRTSLKYAGSCFVSGFHRCPTTTAYHTHPTILGEDFFRVMTSVSTQPVPPPLPTLHALKFLCATGHSQRSSRVLFALSEFIFC